MSIGPGKYDAECTQIREQTKARGVVVIVWEGDRGSGFSCQGDMVLNARLPEILELTAAQIRKDMEG